MIRGLQDQLRNTRNGWCDLAGLNEVSDVGQLIKGKFYSIYVKEIVDDSSKIEKAWDCHFVWVKCCYRFLVGEREALHNFY